MRDLPTLAQCRAKIRAGDMTPAEVIAMVSDAIDRKDSAINAYLSCDVDPALCLATGIDTSLPLAGVPIAVKSNINVLGQATSCASKFLGPYISPYDATAVRLLKQAGGVPMGRLNMDEFAMGASGENSAYGITRNPHAVGRVPGGSSSGSAAAVAAGMAIAALGSDTGGSIRQPASHCGIVGLKPTYGRVSRYGLVAFASSLDQIGPMTQTVEDAAILLNAICGHDVMDSTSVNCPVEDYETAIGKDIKGMRIGVAREHVGPGNHPAVNDALQATVRRLEALGAEVVDISLPHTEAVVATYYIIACAEASSNLSRFDGVRYGKRSEEITDILSVYTQSREQGFGAEVKKRIILGTYVLSSGYYDAYYGRAQRVRTLIADDFTQAFASGVDAILAPVSPTPAPHIGEHESDPLQAYLADIYTIPANLAGLPAISFPIAKCTEDDGELPIGMQLIGSHFGESAILRLAHAYEQS